MKDDLPFLNQQRLDAIFNNVYSGAVPELHSTVPFEDERLEALARILFAMQHFNYQFRPDATHKLYSLMSKIIKFEQNSEGTTLWLALILAIKELYGFSNKKLVEVMKQVSVRK
ncbi:MAG: hypothetical protein DSY85_08540 [Marinomonas sp.]|nr:MAG: hypothetical protein DSY85_08540 [Marinomonas sp.]